MRRLAVGNLEATSSLRRCFIPFYFCQHLHGHQGLSPVSLIHVENLFFDGIDERIPSSL